MNKSGHKPIFGGSQQKAPQRSQPPQQQTTGQKTVPQAPSSNAQVHSQSAGGRNVNNAMIKNTEQDRIGQQGSAQPFNGYSSVTQNGLSSSRVNDNPKENPMIQSFVKEVVNNEVNEKYKSIIEKNQKLEEQLKQSSNRIKQLETSIMQGSQLHDVSGISNILDLSEIHSVIGNNQHIEELSNNYSYIKNNVDNLQKQIDEDIKQNVLPTLQGMNQKDTKSQQLLEQMNKKYESQLNLIEDQIKIYSSGTGSNAKVEGIDEVTVKKLEAEQIKVKSEMLSIKELLEAIKNDQINSYTQQINDKIQNMNKEFNDLKQSIANIKTELVTKLNGTAQGKNLSDQSMRQSTTESNYQKQIEELQKTVRMLQSKQVAAPSDLERENRELKEKLNKFQNQTSNQIEELRRLILSNPQMQMEASQYAYRQQNTYEQFNNYISFDDRNIGQDGVQQIYQDYKSRQQSEQDIVEVATLDSKNSNYEIRNMEEVKEKQNSVTFGGQDNQFENNQNENNQYKKFDSTSSLEIAAKLISPQDDLSQSNASLQSSEEIHRQVLNNLTGYRQQGSDPVSIKMTQSTTSIDQLSIPKHKKSDVVIGEIEEEEGETLVFDKKTKLFSPVGSPLKPNSGKSGNLSVSQMKMMQSADNMRKSQINESKQLFEVNVHDLTFKDENVTQYFNEKTSLNEMAYSIMVSEPERDSQGNILSEKFISELAPVVPKIHKTTTLENQINPTSQAQNSSPAKSNTYPPKQTTPPPQQSSNLAQPQSQPMNEGNSPQVKASLSPSHAMKISGDEPPEDEDYDSDEEEAEKQKPKQPDNQNEEQKEDDSEQNSQHKSSVDNKGGEYLTSSVNSGMQDSKYTVPSQQFDDQEEVVYELDENGYLMDENGNYILGDDGEMVKLEEDDIQYLKQTNILEEN